MKFTTLTLLLSTLASLSPLLVSAQSSNTSAPSPCPSPSGFANIIIRAPLPSSPKLQPSPSFLSQHILFFYTDTNIRLSQAAFASFCLDQCVAYQPNPNATNLPSETPALPPFFVTNRPGPCRSFTVDQGKPFPPNPNDTAPRWYCEAFDEYLAEDGRDFVPVDAPGSYLYGLGVNRACGGTYRAY